jgi:hypothetical protein
MTSKSATFDPTFEPVLLKEMQQMNTLCGRKI